MFIHHMSYEDWSNVFEVWANPETYLEEVTTYDVPEWVLFLYEYLAVNKTIRFPPPTKELRN